MEKITDPNPYEVLEIGPDTDRRAIKQALADRQRKSRTQAERQQALSARNALASTEKRLFVDAMTPPFTSLAQAVDLEALVDQLADGDEAPGPGDFIPFEQAIAADLEALIGATVNHTLGAPASTRGNPELLTAFDGLDTFLEGWIG